MIVFLVAFAFGLNLSNFADLLMFGSTILVVVGITLHVRKTRADQKLRKLVDDAIEKQKGG